MEDTKEIPPALNTKPEPSQWAKPYWDAFNKLSSSRQFTQVGPLAIAFSEIKAYLDLYNIKDLDDIDTYVSVIQQVDAAYLEYISKKLERKTNGN